VLRPRSTDHHKGISSVEFRENQRAFNNAVAQKGASMNRRRFFQTSLAASALALSAERCAQRQPTEPLHETAGPSAFELDETTIADLRQAMESGKYSARGITELYLKRIDQIDRNGPAVNSVIEVNPDALAIAEALDDERKSGKVRGPLHGIPILIKDNIETADKMRTSAGSLALAESIAAADSGVAARLREAGAVILGKTNLSEWANFRSSNSSSGWSGRGGQTHNPYALDRNPCGSSSGSGAAASANLCAAAIGTETNGSIVCPSNANGLVGIKPTVGLVSRAGIIPISHTQDTAGPMARTVADAAALLGVLTGNDLRDEPTAASVGKAHSDYTPFLDANGLRGARIGVARNFEHKNPRVMELIESAIEAMKNAGAEIIDPAEIPHRGDYGGAELEVLLYEFKAGLNAYLETLGAAAPLKSLADVIAFNEENADREMPYFRQEIFLKAESKGPLTEKVYQDALAKCRRFSRAEGIDKVIDAHKLDAVIAPTGGPAWPTDYVNGDHSTGGSSSPAAISGYPNITVPAGFVSGLPVGISFIGRAWSEPTLIKLAYGFEQATKHREPPKFLPTLTA
jgi:amidase